MVHFILYVYLDLTEGIRDVSSMRYGINPYLDSYMSKQSAALECQKCPQFKSVWQSFSLVKGHF
jgi:hypothetical protein